MNILFIVGCLMSESWETREIGSQLMHENKSIANVLQSSRDPEIECRANDVIAGRFVPYPRLATAQDKY